MTVIFPVGPYSLRTWKSLAVGWNETCWSICIPAEDIKDEMWCKNMKNESPLDLKQWNVVQACSDKLFHLINGCCMLHGTELKFCYAPVLLNEIEFAMILWVEIAEVAAGLDEFLKLRLVTGKVTLWKKKLPTAAVSTSRGAAKIWTLSNEALSWP